MSITGIPYADHSINPVVGCTPCSPACPHCWSKELHDMRHKAYRTSRNGLPEQYKKPFSEIQLLPERLEELKHLKKPKTVAMCFTSDLFHEKVPDEFIINVYVEMALCPQHTFLILTKRIKRAAVLCRQISNVVMGISIWNQESADRDIPILLDCWKGRTWISYEPALGGIFLNPPLLRQIDYVVAGCESGKNRRPCQDNWLDFVAEQCKESNVPCLIKQREINGKVIACEPCKDFFRR